VWLRLQRRRRAEALGPHGTTSTQIRRPAGALHFIASTWMTSLPHRGTARRRASPDLAVHLGLHKPSVSLSLGQSLHLYLPYRHPRLKFGCPSRLVWFTAGMSRPRHARSSAATATSQLRRPRRRTGLHHSSARPACTKRDRHHAFCLRQALGKHPTPKARLWYVACLSGLGAASSTFLRRHVITTVGHSRPRLHTTVPAPVCVRSHSTITAHAQRCAQHDNRARTAVAWPLPCHRRTTPSRKSLLVPRPAALCCPACSPRHGHRTSHRTPPRPGPVPFFILLWRTRTAVDWPCLAAA
jgi:hypothetical protein